MSRQSPHAATQSLTGTPDEIAEVVLDIENQHGLHARPAAAFVQTASRFSSIVEVSNLTAERGSPPRPAASPAFHCSISAREIALRSSAAGSDCQAALQAIRDLASAGFGEKIEGEARACAPANAGENQQLRLAGSPAPTVSRSAHSFALQSVEVIVDDTAPDEPAVEIEKLTGAMEAVRGQLQRSSGQSATNCHPRSASSDPV